MRFPWLLLFVFFLVFGCSGGPKIALVSGTVTLDGKPLPNARVNFQPAGDDRLYPGVGSYGKTDKNGNYSLNLIDGTGKGAIVGKHRVMIRAIAAQNTSLPGKDPEKASPDKVPPQYNVNSILTFDVTAGDNTADWILESKPKK
jgi:hypothetical protein